MTEPYRCPVCHSNDRDWYLNCNHPGCMDGRDQARNRILPREEWPELRSVEMHEKDTKRTPHVLWLVVIVLVLILLFR